jgi:ligand-binding sensor domain-containing protein
MRIVLMAFLGLVVASFTILNTEHVSRAVAPTVEDLQLPSESVTALAALPDGTIAVGTRRGLLMKSGSHWNTFRVGNGGRPDRAVGALCVSADRSLWIGTAKGLWRFHDSEWNVYRTSNSELPGDEVSAISQGHDGVVWVGTNCGLARIRRGELTNVRRLSAVLAASPIHTLKAADDGSVWIGTMHRGVLRLQGGNVTSYDSSNSNLPSNSVRAIWHSDDKTVWFGTAKGLAYIKDGEQRVSLYPYKLPDDSIHAISEAKRELLIGTNSGLIGANERGWRSLWPDGATRGVSSVLVTAGGVIWIGGIEGVAVIEERRSKDGQ